MITVPQVFKAPTTWQYPKYNLTAFEEFFYKYYVENKVQTKREYLPVFWSGFYYSRRYRTRGTQDLQAFLNGLDPSLKYFTTAVYDGGIHEDTSHLDLELYSAVGDSISANYEGYCGKLGDYAIPILCRPSPVINLNKSRDIFCGFIGAKTHPMRELIWEQLTGKDGFVVEQSPVYPCTGFRPMTKSAWEAVNFEHFQDIMERSVFALCPRGSSTVTFRVCECLHYGCVPVYVSDKFWFPYSNPKDQNDHGVFDQIGITCHPEQIHQLPERLRAIPQDQINWFLENGRRLRDSHFTYEGCAQRIIERVNE